ncbi:MAG: restriction endonuclease subunit S [Candidatus Moraniibacteriota bacterium]|nr:MAG: restriction endonuclease subunit S [Candidatus Moranbacteria bacterium]
MKNNWQRKKLGEVCEIITGNTPKTSIIDYYGNSYLWAGPSDLDQGKYILETKKKLSNKGFYESGIRRISSGSVLMSCIGNIGKLSIAKKEMATNQQINSFVPIKNLVDSEYLYYILQTKIKDFESKSSKTTVPIINKSKCSEIEIPLPSLEEQKRIVKRLERVLGEIQNAKRINEEALSDINQLLPAELSKIFAGGKEKGWEEKELGNSSILKMTSGGTPKRSMESYYKGDIVWLKSGELKDSVNILDSKEKISKEAVQKSSAKIFSKGAVLFAMYGATAGKTGILGIDASTNQAIAGMTVNKEKLNNKYLYYFLLKKRNDILLKAWGGAQPNLSQTILKKIKIPLPSLSEQKEIVDRLDAISEKAKKLRELHIQNTHSLTSLEQSVLSQAFQEE